MLSDANGRYCVSSSFFVYLRLASEILHILLLDCAQWICCSTVFFYLRQGKSFWELLWFCFFARLVYDQGIAISASDWREMRAVEICSFLQCEEKRQRKNKYLFLFSLTAAGFCETRRMREDQFGFNLLAPFYNIILLFSLNTIKLGLFTLEEQNMMTGRKLCVLSLFAIYEALLVNIVTFT